MSMGVAGVKRRAAELLDDPQFPRNWRSQDGFAVVMVVIIMIIMALLGLSLLTVAAYQYNDTDRTTPSNRAFDLADSGLAYGRAYLSRDNEIDPDVGYESGTIEMAEGSTFAVNIEKIDGYAYRYRIVSTGTYQAQEKSGARGFSRSLEETVEYRGLQGYLDAFNYCMYSEKGDVSLNTGWLAVNSTRVQVDGKIFAGRDLYLKDEKAAVGLGNLTVNGDVVAGRDAFLKSYTGLIGNGSDSVNGDLTAGRNVEVSARTGALAGSTWVVSGNVNAGGNVSLTATSGALAGATVQVAQNAGTSLNAGGNVTLNSNVLAAAGSTTQVGAGSQPSTVNANGNVEIRTNAEFIAGATARVFGNVNAKGNTIMNSTCGLLAYPKSRVDGSLRNNGSSTLYSDNVWLILPIAVGACEIGGAWQHGGTCSDVGNNSFGSHSHVSPVVGDAPVQAVPDVTMPQPDWDWYRTMAIAQGHYYTGNGDPYDSTPQNITNVTIDGDPSSMWVLYCTDDLTIENVIYNVQKKGVIVCEGDVKVTHSVQWQPNTEYQVIAAGDISHASYFTLNPYATDSIFLYTNGTHDHDRNPATTAGNVSYDLGWFRDLKGQITCTGNITASVGGFARDARIIYQAPSVPVEAWPIPFKVLSFREL